MILFARDLSDDAERESYYKHFSPKKLQQALAEIETNAGFPESPRKTLSDIRSKMYNMYSKTVHNSYVSLIFIGAMRYSFEDEPLLSSNLFGRANKASYPTLHHMTGHWQVLT